MPNDRQRDLSPFIPLVHGLAIAASAIPASLLCAYLGQAYINGFDGLILGLALLGGTVLSGILITPALQKSGTASLAAFMTVRLGPTAGLVTGLIMAGAAVLLMTAELVVASRVVSDLANTSRPAMALVLSGSAAALVLLTRTRAGAHLLCALAVVLIVSLSASVWCAGGGDAFPHLTYGAAVTDIAGHEARMMEAGLADFRSLKAHTRAFLELDPLNTTALAVTLLAGAVLLVPASKQPHLTARSSRLATAVAATAAMSVLISVPALAAYAKRDVYAAIVRATPLTALPVWMEAPSRRDLVRVHGLSAKMIDDVALAIKADTSPDVAKAQTALLSDPLRGDTAQAFAEAKPQVKSALLDAAKKRLATPELSSWALLQETVLPQAALAQNNKTGLLTHGALWVSPWAVPLLIAGLSQSAGLVTALFLVTLVIGAAATLRRLADGVVRASLPVSPKVEWIVAVLVLGLATTGALMAPAADGVWLALTAFSIAAAGLFPACLAAAWSKRVSAVAVIAALCIGATAAGSYALATHGFPAETYEATPSLSMASDAAKKKFELLKAAWQKSPDGPVKDAAWSALETYAAGNATRPNMAAWWGIASAHSAIFALPLAVLALLIIEIPARLVRRSAPKV